jgi:NitT/TauT family transport system substrate-binding protein
MRMRIRRLALSSLAVLLLLAAVPPAPAQTKLRVGFCTKTLTSAVAPFAVATQLGWFREEGLDVELVPVGGSSDCVRYVATGELPYSLPSIEPLAIGRAQGIRARIFYTAYQGNPYGIAVPADSPVQRIEDLRGKTIGVTDMGSAGVVIARALAAAHGLDPDRDITVVVAGSGAQTAAMVRNGQVQALSQFDTHYALVENAGVKLRRIEHREFDRFPANGFITLEKTLAERGREAVGLARAYAKGTVFTVNNPEAAVRITYAVYPQIKPSGKDEATAVRDEMRVISARAPNWRLEKAGVSRWGENSVDNYGAYLDFLLRAGVVKQKLDARDFVTNDLIDEINRFDAAKIAAQAKAHK